MHELAPTGALLRAHRGTNNASAFSPLQKRLFIGGLMPRAAIFDVDGTLVDSVDLHALAWCEAFAHFGPSVSTRRVVRLERAAINCCQSSSRKRSCENKASNCRSGAASTSRPII
ncbi:protein of unknown function (plasmid) [Caballeronia sp. S22]